MYNLNVFKSLLLENIYRFIMKAISKPVKYTLLKSRDITLSTKVTLVRAMVSPVVMYGCESLAIKKLEHQRISAFELWCWRRLLRVLWTARRSKPVHPKGNQFGLFI